MGNDFLLGSKRVPVGRLAAFLAVFAVASGALASSAQIAALANSAAGIDETIFTRIVPNDCQAPTDSQIADVKSAVTSFHGQGDRSNESRALMLLGTLYEQRGEYQLALPSLESALKLAQDDASKAKILTMTADALTNTGNAGAAAKDATDALNLSKDPNAKGDALRARAEANFYAARDKTIEDLNAALKLIGDAGDPKTKAMILTDQGAAEQDSGSPFESFISALQIEGQIHDCRDEIAALVGLATLEHDRGHLRDALDHLDQAVALEGQVGDRTMEAQTLHQLGYFHSEIGDLGQAFSSFNQALKLKQQAGDRSSEAMTMGAIAGLDREMQLPAAALRAYLRVLPMLQGNRPWRVMVLNNLGAVEADLHNKAVARTYYTQAMQIAQSSQLNADAMDPVTPAYSEWGIGELEQSDALPSYFQSVRMAREYEQSDLEGMVDASLMDHFRSHHQPNVAIFFGKRAVDQFQLIRRGMNGMNNDLTSAFLHKKSEAYRTLAEILTDQGRLIEAQQVLDLLKIQQYSDYVGTQLSELSQPLPRSAREGPLQQQLEEQIAQLVSLEKALVAAQGKSRAQTPAVVQSRAALSKAEAGFTAFLQDLYRQLEAKDGPAVAVEKVSGVELPLERLIGDDTQSAAIYTLEGADRFRVIVISHSGRSAHFYPIVQDALDQKCEQFLETLKDHGESTAAAQDLFKVIFGPVEKNLEDMGATTLVWYLDGSLRYIPIPALQNPQTKRYLVDEYNIINFTPLNHSLEEAPQLSGANAIGMGTSRNYDDDLGPLTNAVAELESIVSDPTDPHSHGVLPGAILPDEKFTKKAMEEGLKSQAVVHIATHFVLTPGNDDLSYLLLGGDKEPDKAGYKYSMADFAKSQDLHIEGTRLLTLSACETGAENKRDMCFEDNKSSVTITKCKAGEANQREDGVVMEGMSEAVLEKGAEAVLSSLWSVNDESTGDLMADFYSRWTHPDGKKVTKIQALTEAERDLLHERIKPKPDYSDPNAPTSFADPYYWAPFVLMGNWQ